MVVVVLAVAAAVVVVVVYALSESIWSAWPFFFLNSIHSKWCKLDFELNRIHTKNIAFCNTFAQVSSKL